MPADLPPVAAAAPSRVSGAGGEILQDLHANLWGALKARRGASLPSATYADHALGQSFDQRREQSSAGRRALRWQSCVALCAIAVVLGLVFGLS